MVSTQMLFGILRVDYELVITVPGFHGKSFLHFSIPFRCNVFAIDSDQLQFSGGKMNVVRLFIEILCLSEWICDFGFGRLAFN